MITRILQGCNKCGYCIEAYLAGNEVAIEHGFKTEATIKCPNCGEYNLIKSIIRHDRQRTNKARN